MVVVYNMQREAPRTLYSLSAEYQDADANQYEVIVVENGSTRPLSQQRVEQMGSNFRYFYLEDAPASPAYAVNFGVQQARGPMVGVMIDGARIVTPGIVQTVMRAYRAYENPLVSTLAWHIGPDIQYRAIKEQGYNTAIEDELLDQSEWMADGYRLFDISTLGGSSADGWLMPTAESNCLFLLRTMYEKLGGFDERFDMPGGGLVNLDFYRRACEYHDTVLIVMLGEGSFHQMHGGIMTNQYEQAYRSKLGPQYREITGRRFQPPVKKPVYWGNIHRYMLPSLQESVQKVLDMDS
ncbi:MAG: glycosyltransferase family A protein [Chloroflexota bacterium]